MISINFLGIIIPIFIYIPYIFYFFFGKPKKGIVKHKQLKILEIIGKYGVLFFGFISIEDSGYKFLNLPLEIIWICIFFILLLFYYFCWLRYFIKGRKEQYLYDKVIIFYPIGVTECFIYFISGVLLCNIPVILFSILYGISHILLRLRRF